MSLLAKEHAETSEAPALDFEVIIVGAGFSGLSSLHYLRRYGLSARLLDDGEEVGGTWNWNRYPGARTDCEATSYSLRLAELSDWEWSESFPNAGEVQRYLKFVSERLELRDHIELQTRVVGATYEDSTATWIVETNKNTYRSKFLVMGLGTLSKIYTPDFAGIADFKGRVLSPQRWPEDPDIANKRVAIIGAGATAIQMIPEVAAVAAEFTVFQREPNYVTPSGNRPYSPEDQVRLREEYEETWDRVENNAFQMDFGTPTQNTMDVSEAERMARYEACWQKGGMSLLFESFVDATTDPEANALLGEFIRAKIRGIVTDPETAEKLCPTYPYGSKRPPAGTKYYEAFNRENVRLVDVKSDPIAQFESNGLRLESGTTYEFDVVILATGFDAFSGSYLAFPITGRNGRTLAEKWADRLLTYLGVLYEGFPNLFVLLGPHGPFANIPPISQLNAEWTARLINHAVSSGYDVVEARPEAEAEWTELVNEIASEFFIYESGLKTRAWFTGGNVPGKLQAPQAYMGGGVEYRKMIRELEDSGYKGIDFGSRR